MSSSHIFFIFDENQRSDVKMITMSEYFSKKFLNIPGTMLRGAKFNLKIKYEIEVQLL